MDKLLDKEVHQLYKAPSLSTYLATSPNNIKPPLITTASAHLSASVSTQVELPAPPRVAPCKTPSSVCDSDESLSNKEDAVRTSSSTLIGSTSCGDVTAPMAAGGEEGEAWMEGAPQEEQTRAQSLEYLNLERKFSDMNVSSGRGARPKTSLLCRYNRYRYVQSCIINFMQDIFRFAESHLFYIVKTLIAQQLRRMVKEVLITKHGKLSLDVPTSKLLRNTLLVSI